VPGSDAVRKAVEKFKPDILLCGHVHEAEGLEEVIGKTRVINVGRKGKIITL
jgi:Icc-related predicted phosphoesterase